MFLPLVADIIANEKHALPIAITLILVSFYSSSALLNFYVGHLADSRGSQGTILARGIALISLAFLGFALALAAPTNGFLYFLVAGVAILVGFGSSSYHPVGAAIIQASFGPGDSGKALGFNGAWGQVGAAVFPPLFFALVILFGEGGLLPVGEEYALVLAVMSTIGVLAAFAIWRGLKDYRVARDPVDGGRRRGMKEALTKGILVLTVLTFVRSIANTGVSAWCRVHHQREGGGSRIDARPYPGRHVHRGDPRSARAGNPRGKAGQEVRPRSELRGAALAVFGYISTGGYLGLACITVFGFFSFRPFPTQPWYYVLIPHDAIDASATFSSLVRRYRFRLRTRIDCCVQTGLFSVTQ